MSTELPKAYDAKSVDSKWYRFWEESGFFKGDPESTKEPYCIVIPPPNVTGNLHMGHALVDTLQDVLIRWKRMSGFEAIWIPGTDHAGIATQTVVERYLMQTMGKGRRDFTREEFLKHMWAWKEKNQHTIISQLKLLGCSCDWSRERFTLDDGNNQAVRTTFKKLFDEGLIYRGKRLVNWDPVTQTTLSDEEVEYDEKIGHLWYFKYPIKGEDAYAHIATTRPETMLGDTAVAVSPKDERYRHLIGKMIVLPIVGREIPIIADHMVDPEFGTGMVKVTPAHDPNDYQMGLKHDLPMINIMTPDGRINEAGGAAFQGLSMEEARKAIVEEFSRLGLLEKIDPHTNRVGVSYRSKAVIEPYLSEQWFIKIDGFAQKLHDAMESGAFKILPKQWESTYNHWVNNLRDWCISRQLWWGHRIPIWYSKDDPTKFICDDHPDGPEEVRLHPDKWQQEEDVLDTWFSSGLWPFAALGWPEKTPELERFYPNAVLVTGHDILFFWVTRMVMFGEYLMGQVPFPEAFLHGLIYAKSYWRIGDKGSVMYVSPEERKLYESGKPIPKDVQSKWEKMSKTKGNIIDPIEVIDEYGTDAMRMALCASGSQNREIDLDNRRFEEFKNFANKIWNGSRFVFMNLEGDEGKGTSALTAEEFAAGLDENTLELEDRWILSLLNKTIVSVNKHLGEYLFEQATLEAYDFFWKEFCAYYVEIAKPALFGEEGPRRKNKQKLLIIVLLNALRLLHPMAPFITEELFQRIKERLHGAEVCKKADPYTLEAMKALASPSCMVSCYPQLIRQQDLNPEIDSTFALMEEIVYAIRNMRGEMKIPPGTATDVYLVAPDAASFETLNTNLAIIRALVKVKNLTARESEPVGLGATAIGMASGIKVIVPISVELLEKEKLRLQKEKERLEGAVAKIRTQLDNEEFVKNAPSHLVEKQLQTAKGYQQELATIELKRKELP